MKIALAAVILAVTGARSENIPPASIDKDVLPYLASELHSLRTKEKLDMPDRSRLLEIIDDLCILGPKASAALPDLRALSSKFTHMTAFSSAAISRIERGQTVRDCGDPIPKEPAEPVVDDIVTHASMIASRFRVGEPVDVSVRTETYSVRRYFTDRGHTAFVARAWIKDREGRRRAVSRPLSGFSYSAFPAMIFPTNVRMPEYAELRIPDYQDLVLNSYLILDTPGVYEVEIESLAKSTPTAQETFRSKPAVVRFTLLPRQKTDPAKSLGKIEAWSYGGDKPPELESGKYGDFDYGAATRAGFQFDYDQLPSVLARIDGQGNGANTLGYYAEWSLSFFCDKQRVRDEVLRYLDAHPMKRIDWDADHWARILAGTEAVPCGGPESSRNPEDYVRYNVARLRWRDRLAASDSPRK